jgi:SAM-dependent methyltransferase
MSDGGKYEQRINEEVARFREVIEVHNLPDSFHYWSNKYLLPKLRLFGFGNSEEFYLGYMSRACLAAPERQCHIISVGAGNCEIEVRLAEKLYNADCRNFRFECLDVNSHMLERGLALAKEHGVGQYMTFTSADFNKWEASCSYQIVIANHALHHFLDLEVLFDRIYRYLELDGHFLTHDMIGRNGHMRWPETLNLVQALWQELPDKYKYNHQLKRFEPEFINWDCSNVGFEGVRSQDILPLLTEKFAFEFFLAWGGVIDVFIERSFGHNFDPKDEWDLNFIDQVQQMNERYLESGLVKPTQMFAAMTKAPVFSTQQYKHLSPQFCTRWPQWSA